MKNYDLGRALMAVGELHAVVTGVDYVGGDRFEEGSLRLQGWRVRFSVDREAAKLEASLQERVPSLRRGDPDYVVRRRSEAALEDPLEPQLEGFLREFSVLPSDLSLDFEEPETESLGPDTESSEENESKQSDANG